MHKFYLLTLSFFAFFISFSQQNEVQSFNKIKFDKVVAYQFDNSSYKVDRILNKNGQLQQHSIQQEKELSYIQINYLHSTLLKNTVHWENQTQYGYIRPRPYLGIVYYLNNKIVGSININIDCSDFESTFFKTKKTHFTQTGYKKILTFCQVLEFSSCAQLKR